MITMLEELIEKLDKNQFVGTLDRLAQEWKNEEIIHKSQLERFHQRILSGMSFGDIVEKIILKYDNDEYHRKWMRRGVMPPESLYFFLYDYVATYGREATENECEEFGNMFTTGLYFIHNYYFNKMVGQGSCILITKQEVI